LDDELEKEADSKNLVQDVLKGNVDENGDMINSWDELIKDSKKVSK